MFKVYLDVENFYMEYASYVVDAYGWARQATLYDIIWLEDVMKYGDDIMKRKAREMMKMVDRVRKSSLEKSRELAVC